MAHFRPPARAIILSGFMGTGKSAVGTLLAERWGLKLIETDALIEEQEGVSIAEIFASRGEAYFRDRETASLLQVLDAEGLIVSTGGGMLLRDENVELLRTAGPIICLHASPATVLARTSHSRERPLLNKPHALGEIERLLAARQETYQRADYHVDTDDVSPEEVADRCAALLASDCRAVFLLPDPVQVPVELGADSYVIHVGEGLLQTTGHLVPPPEEGLRAGIITADNLIPLYAEAVRASLSAEGWQATIFPVPDGEASKSLGTAERLYNALLEAGFDRSSVIFAVGGGVIGDLAGFVAATFMRGLKLVQLPTSLLAQVDASVGGKVAVNLPAAKNLVGAFHQPHAVIIDTQSLQTLPRRQLRSGLAEAIKHAAIADAEMFAYLEGYMPRILTGDPVALKYLLARNCQIKGEVVSQDPHEQGWRAVLNYGHTIGHALERAASHWALCHGEAVALGMIAESQFTAELDLAEPSVVSRLCNLIEQAGLPTTASGIDLEQAAAALVRDKKIASGRLRLPVVPKVGQVKIVEHVPPAALQQAMANLVE